MKRILFTSGVALVLGLVMSTGSISTPAGAQNGSGNRIPAEFVSGRVLVKFRSEILPDHARQIIAALGARDADEIEEIDVHILDLPPEASERAFVQAFMSRPEVEFAELDKVLPVEQLIPNDPVFSISSNSWSLHKIRGPEAWSLTAGSSNVTIAILDTGVDGTHEDLMSKMISGWNIYNNNSDTRDVTTHGTAVAGVAAASTNNAIGVASVAWECKLMPVRVSQPDGYATYSAIANGLTWAADNGARVANISYNVTGSSTVSSAAKYFQNKGGVVASAAGNQGTSVQTSNDPYILTVGATDSSDVLYYWSNSGKNLDLVAPGNASVPLNGGGYGGSGGTSISSPLVAGAAALIFSINPRFSPKQVQDILKLSTDDLGALGWDSTYGYGRLNLERAVVMAIEAAGNVDDIPPNVSIVSPGDADIVSGIVTVSHSTVDNVGVVKVELLVDGLIYGSSTTAPFSVKWNTRKLARGQHAIQSRAYDAVGNMGTSPIVSVYK